MASDLKSGALWTPLWKDVDAQISKSLVVLSKFFGPVHFHHEGAKFIDRHVRVKDAGIEKFLLKVRPQAVKQQNKRALK